ncbi:pyridoxamine 5'-phosphate oxidase family protein [Accumulibacter sp.]|uniref:pyridoxamine 5'-phosphate oxidase family protein n=1 Tax=Accumulibacter sp. TaxID=2053492 RepID=UPI0028C49F5C|nr:pyridoxamine 5'-phosphate oxidase family protein [Accumulibacter sp.]
MLTDDVLNYIKRSVLCWLATADADGAPNVSPKEVFCAFGRDSVHEQPATGRRHAKRLTSGRPALQSP